MEVKLCVRRQNATLFLSMMLFAMLSYLSYSVSARPGFMGVIDYPLLENLGVICKVKWSELFYVL